MLEYRNVCGVCGTVCVTADQKHRHRSRAAPFAELELAQQRQAFEDQVGVVGDQRRTTAGPPRTGLTSRSRRVFTAAFRTTWLEGLLVPAELPGRADFLL